MKRKLFIVPMGLLLGASLYGCTNKETLVLYNWGEYIDNSNMDGVNLIKKFEREYNCKVKTPYFDSNEAAITSMETESYDIVIPSEYAIEQLALNDKIEEIDWTKVEGFTKDDISTPLKTMLTNLNSGENGFDFLKYSVPYFFGSVGICYNKENVSLEDLKKEGWNIFKNEKYRNRVAYYDSSRDGFMVPLKALGYSMNTTSTAEVDLAYNWLTDMKSKVNPSFKTDELLSEVPEKNNNIDLALMYSGDAIYTIRLAKEKNYELGFYLPSSDNEEENFGTNIFADGMVIPKNAKNKELAYKFISFMCRKENAIANSEYVGYSSSVNSAFKELVSEDGEFSDYKEIYSVPVHSKDEIFRFNSDMKKYMNNKWTSLKA